MPDPMLGVHVSPSSSVNAIRLVFAGSNCDTNVRLVVESVKRIGSKVVIDVVGADLFTHAAVPLPSLNVTRSVCTPAMNIALPLFQFRPMVGSPALLPRVG